MPNVFDDADARRLLVAANRIEAMADGGGLDTSANGRRALIRRAVLTTALTAATATQAGSGMATIQQMSATGAFTTMIGPTGAALPAQKVWNPYTSAGVSGRVVLVVPSGGQWIVVGYDCP